MGGLRMKNAIISGSDLRMSQLTQNEAMVGVDLEWGHWMKCSLGLFVSVCITAGLHQHLTSDITATKNTPALQCVEVTSQHHL